MLIWISRFFFVVALVGCVASSAVQRVPTHQSTPTALSSSSSLEAQLHINPTVAFRNTPPPVHATAPDTGAAYVYARVGSQNSRLAPVDIEIEVRGSHGLNQAELVVKLNMIYRAIYGWNPDAWRASLEGRSDLSDIITTKSNFFWESLAQHVAERVFAEFITPPIYLYGPKCVNTAGALTCPTDALPQIDEVRVKTTIDGRRDPLNPQTRSIMYVARRGQLANPDVYLELHVPAGIRVAGPEQEHLDLRPRIGGDREAIRTMRVLAHLPARSRTRTKNEHYADYNLLFVPLRHVVFQGQVGDPKGPETAMEYPNIEALHKRFAEVIHALRSIPSAQAIARRLRPFISPKYYYMFDNGQGVDGYRAYILGDGGIGGSITPDIGDVQLLIEE